MFGRHSQVNADDAHVVLLPNRIELDVGGQQCGSVPRAKDGMLPGLSLIRGRVLHNTPQCS
jgi:hypothetical protein